MPPPSRKDSRDSPAIPLDTRRAVRRKLLSWFDRHKRDLPWRHRRDDAYAQWVAEIMLQQTRVDTVKEYYTRFMTRFPTVGDLAKARHDSVLKQWEGLGYYRRALNLHRAARTLRNEDRDVPTTAHALRRLPGIGDYTSAAIASIAFGERVAAVDGNVARVVARLFGVEEDVLFSRGKARIAQVAQELIPVKRPGDFNQAWMDLGSMVCTPRGPSCGCCPLHRECVAAATDRTDELPVRDGGRRGREIPQIKLVAALFVAGGRLYVRRRALGGLWSGLWEFPSVERNGHGSARRIVRDLAQEEALQLDSDVLHAGRVRHRLTHRDLEFDVDVAPVHPHRAEGTGKAGRWVTRAALARLSVSTAHRRIFDAARSIIEASRRERKRKS